MKRAMLFAVLALVTVTVVLPAAAQDEPKAEMQMYQLVLVKHGPNWKSQATQEGMDLRMQVIENIKKGAREGVIVGAGLVNDETDVEFILIFDVETKHEAEAIAAAAPNVKNGMYKPEIYSWFATKLAIVTK